ncbi:hypothetical protein O1M63_28945 [Streptomyces mirabilis]|nr:hypothetical protein [Streptomyces mirabilis]
MSTRTEADRWESVGPYSSAATVECLSGPDGDRLVLVSSPATAGGFWSENSGATWQPVKPPSRYPVGTCLVGSHANPRRWWLSTTALPGAHESGIFRTDDKGASWERLDVEVPEGVQSISAHRKGQVLVALTAAGDTYVSRDGGDTWKAEDLMAGRAVSKLAFLGDDLIFQAQQTDVLYAVRDAAGEPQPPALLEFLKNEQALFSWDGAGHTIGAVVLGPGGGLVISRDAGDTWADPLQDLYGGTAVVSASREGDQILYQSTEVTQLDTGDGSFRKVQRPGDTVAGFCPLPEGGWLAADSVHGLYSTTNWKNFERVGVPASFVTALAAAEGAVLAGTETGVLRAPVPVAGPDWESPDGLFASGNHVVDMDVWADNRALVWRTRRIGLKCAAERSLDAGLTWQERGSWPDAIFAVHIHPQDPDRVMLSFGYMRDGVEALGVRTTNDGGVFWMEHDHGRYYLDLAADPGDPDGVWMASYTNGLYYSGDFGESWEAKTADEASSVHLAGSRLLIGGEAIRYSDDGGTTFRAARIEDGDDPVRVVAFAQHDGVLFAATASVWYPGDPAVITAGRGVLRSRDNGKTWHDASGGLPLLDVRALTVDLAEPCLYAGLRGGSVHRLAL